MDTSPLIKYNSKYKDILHSLILEHIKDKSPCSILDIGCRWGDDLQRIAAINFNINIFGIDVDLGVLKAASKKLKKFQDVYLLQAEGKSAAFKDNYFDIIFSSEVIEHIEEVEKFLKEVYRILKKQGIFIVTTPSRLNYTHLIGKIIPYPFKKYLRKGVYYINPGKDENPHIREYTPKELKKMFLNNGFIVERIESGVLRVPIWPLFDKFPFLVLIWKCLDRFVDKLPWGINLKHNFIMVGRKSLRE